MPLVVRSVDRNILNSLRLLSKQSVRIYKKLSRKLVIVHIKSRSEYIYKSLQKEKKKSILLVKINSQDRVQSDPEVMPWDRT